MTAPEKGRWYWFKNWLHYHWLYLIIAAVALWVGISWLGTALHRGETLLYTLFIALPHSN